MYLAYAMPEVESLDPLNISTTGGNVTILGDNFGNSPELVTVLLGDAELAVRSDNFSHGHMIVDVPAGEGEWCRALGGWLCTPSLRPAAAPPLRPAKVLLGSWRLL